MPSILITLDLNGIPCLPKENKHILQSVLYSLMSDRPDVSAAVHKGIPLSGRYNYKLFTFSDIRSRICIKHGLSLYEGYGELEFRSPDTLLCKTISDAIQKRDSLRLGASKATITGLCIHNKILFTDSLRIRMETPVTVHHSTADHYTHYYHPCESEFGQLISENFTRKFFSCYGELPTSNVQLIPRHVETKDLQIHLFKGTIIKGYLGHFLLQGNPDYLTFLYECGLGDRNSQGFGMFYEE